MCFAQVLTPHVALRLPRWQITGADGIQVNASPSIMIFNHAPVLPALAQLNAIAQSVPKRWLWLSNINVSAEIVNLMAQAPEWDVRVSDCDIANPSGIFTVAVPNLTELHCAAEGWHREIILTDELLRLLIERCPGLQKLTVRDMALNDSHVTSTVQSWRSVQVLGKPGHHVSLWKEITRLPPPAEHPYAVWTRKGDAVIFPRIVMSSTQVRSMCSTIVIGSTYMHVL